MKYTTITNGGLDWRVVSRNERETTHNGRHFFARRCRPGAPWMNEEHDQSITEHGSAKPLRVWKNEYQIEDLSTAVREICGAAPKFRTCNRCQAIYVAQELQCPQCGAEHAELHPSMSWDEHRSRAAAMRAAG